MTNENEYQSKKSLGFIFGIIITPLLLMIFSWCLYRYGFVNNMEARDGTQMRRPVILFIFRLGVLGFSIFTLICVLIVQENNLECLSYLSTWNLALAMEYFAMGVILSHKQYVSDKPLNEFVEPMSTHEKRLKTAHQIIGEIALPCAWMVLSVLWGVAPPPPPKTIFGWYVDILCHIFTACVLTVDFIFADYLVNPIHVSAFFIWTLIYLLCQLILGVACGFVAYDFLITNNKAYVGYYFAIFGIEVVFFWFLMGLSYLKSRGICCNLGIRELKAIRSMNISKFPSGDSSPECNV